MKRRDFLTRTALAGAAGSLFNGSAPAIARAPDRSPNEKVRFACIGVGGKGDSDTNDAGDHGEIVGLCDVDANILDKMGQKYPKAKKYYDYRKMLEELGDKIDAVTVSTPDHTHAPASVMAMRMGKHCFCQKPLTWSVEEARLMRTLAAEKKLCTQMGNQGTAEGGFREGVELIRSGVLGPIKEIHVWTNRPIWPQGWAGSRTRPASPTMFAGTSSSAPRPTVPTIPTTSRSSGAAGSISAPAPWATWPATRSTSPAWPWSCSIPRASRSSTPPASSITRPTRSGRSSAPTSAPANGRGPLTMTWYDGGDKFPENKKAYKELLYGEKVPDSGLLLGRREGLVLLAERLRRRARALAPREVQGLSRSPSRACLGRPATSPSSSMRSSPAIRPRPCPTSTTPAASPRRCSWASSRSRPAPRSNGMPTAMKAKNCPAADQYIRRDYRKGYSIH